MSTFPSKRDNAEEALGHLTALIDMLQLAAYSQQVVSDETIGSATALMQQQLNDIRLGLAP